MAGIHDETMKMIMELGLHKGEEALEKTAEKEDKKVTNTAKPEVKSKDTKSKTPIKEAAIIPVVPKVKSIEPKDIKKVMKAAADAKKKLAKESTNDSPASNSVKSVPKPKSQQKDATTEKIKSSVTKNTVDNNKKITESAPVLKIVKNVSAEDVSKANKNDSNASILKNGDKKNNKDDSAKIKQTATKTSSMIASKPVSKESVKPLSKPFVVPSIKKTNTLKPSLKTTSSNSAVANDKTENNTSIKVTEKNSIRSGDKSTDKSTPNWWLECNKTGIPSLTLPSEGSWYNPIDSTIESNISTVDSGRLKNIVGAVETAFDAEVNAFQKAKGSKMSGDQKWINDVLKSGTTSDKVAALALVVQESPLHELSALDTLIGELYYCFYIDSLTYVFGWYIFLCRIGFCDTVVVIFLK
jgi:ribosome biogenesis protein MAK21